MTQAEKEYDMLRAMGYSPQRIADFMVDGESLKNQGYTDMELVEEIYDIAISEIED